MKKLPFVFLCALSISFACTFVSSTNAQFSRKNPYTVAYAKTKDSIVSIKTPATRYSAAKIVGTGVIIDERGIILTNRHVVGTNRQVPIILSNKEVCTGHVLLSERNHDIAVLQIKTKTKLKSLNLARVDDLMVCEEVMAIGHPYGYANTVTCGKISNLNQKITMPTGESLTGLIMIDASINPGNSGGPLLNINGELIGINVAIRDGANGIAFAINADTIRKVLSEKLSAYKIAGVGHGIYCNERTLAATGDRQRAVVAGIYKKSPADRAGLQHGDHIIQVANYKINNRFDLERRLWDKQPGQEVKMTVIRGEQQLQVTLTLDNLTQPYQSASLTTTPLETTYQVVNNITPTQIQE